MNRVKNSALFHSINEVPRQYPWLCADEECEVLVIGGGSTGCIAAHTLARSGIDTALISQSPIGYSNICADSATLANQNELMLTTLSKVIGRDDALSCFSQLNDSLDYIEKISHELGGFDFKRKDSFLYTDKPEKVNDLHAEYLMRKHNGFDVSFIEKADAREDFSFEVAAGIMTSGGAGELDSYKFCHVLAKDAIDSGARIYENTMATSVSDTDDGSVVVTQYGKRIKANKVLFATGYSQDEYLKLLTAKKTTFFLATKPISSLNAIENQAITRNISDNIHLRTTACNRVIIGGLDCTLVGEENRISRVLGTQGIVERKYSELNSKLQNMLCGVDGLESEYEYRGIYGMTRDYLPVIGENSNYKNVYFDMPTSIHGILYGVIGARIIESLYLGEEVCNIFSPMRETL